MNNLVFLLGASDPEMCRIAALLSENKVPHVYARKNGRIITPKTAYDANGTRKYLRPGQRIVFVECRDEKCKPYRVIDHHQDGDAGYDLPPRQYPLGSSLGQVWAMLVEEGIIHGDTFSITGNEPNRSGWCLDNEDWKLFDRSGRRVNVPADHFFAMAADHCLSFAYRNECPGIAASDLLDWRINVRATFQRRPEDAIRRDILACLDYLDFAALNDYQIIAGEKILNARQMPELAEAAAIKKTGYFLELVDKSTMKIKLKFRAFTADAINAWMSEMSSHGLAYVYGSPARGYAGAVYMLK